MVAREAARGRIADPGQILAALALGTATAAIDLVADSRTALWLLMGGGSLLLGFMTPRAAWRWGLLAGICLPMLVALTGVVGPYGRDRADVWFPLLPCVVLALTGALGGRWVRTRPPDPRPE